MFVNDGKLELVPHALQLAVHGGIVFSVATIEWRYISQAAGCTVSTHSAAPTASTMHRQASRVNMTRM
jgi:hypothetical protein